MILQLKIKALQSLLETQPTSASVSRKKRTSGSSSSSKPQKKQHNSDMNTKRIVTTMRPSGLQRNIASNKFLKKKKKLKAKQFNAPPNTSYRTFQNGDNLLKTKDNYDVQDMEIESTPSTSGQFISPLMCLTNYNNEPIDDQSGFNYLSQQQSFRTNAALLSNPEFYFNQNLQLQQLYGQVPQNQLDKFYQVIGHFPTNSVPNHNPISSNLIPSLLGPHPLQMPRSFSQPSAASGAYGNQTDDAMYPDSILTLEQQQNELNSLIEARYQQEQNFRRNFDYATSNAMNHPLINARPTSQPKSKVNKVRNITTFVPNDDEEVPKQVASPSEHRVIFRVSSPSSGGSSASSPIATETAPKKADKRAFADLDESPTKTADKSKNNTIEAVTKQVDAILTTLNDRMQSVDVDSLEKEKILKANLLRKLMAIKSDVGMAKSEQEPQKIEAKLEQDTDEDKAKAEEEMNQLRTKLLANLSMKRREKQQQQLEQQQESQEKQMDKDMYLLKRKLQEHELMVVEKETTTVTSALAATKATNLTKSTPAMYRKIKPIIIRLNQSISEDEEYVEVLSNPETLESRKQQPASAPTLSLQDNITQFLKEAKNQAERIALHSLLPSCQVNNQQPSESAPFTTIIESPKSTPVSDPVPVVEVKPVTSTKPAVASTPVMSSVQKSLSESEKKLFIKSLRDRINLETKQIGSLQKTSLELKQIEAKKLKDIDATHLKILTLREQLVAAEKVLKVNQESAQTARQQHQLMDSKLEKLQSSKRVRQQFLQKILAISSVKKPTPQQLIHLQTSSSAPVMPTQPRVELASNHKSAAQKRKSPELPMVIASFLMNIIFNISLI